jgi:hypothetical protein
MLTRWVATLTAFVAVIALCPLSCAWGQEDDVCGDTALQALESDLKAARDLDACDGLKAKFQTGKYAACVSGVWDSAVAGYASDCLKRVVIETLDRRLLELKQKDKPQFTKEMKLQRVFNELINEACDGYELGWGTGGKVAWQECQALFSRYRIVQAVQVEKGQLAFAPGKARVTSKKAQEFAKLLCELPADVWKSSQKATDCQDRVLAEMKTEVFDHLPPKH